MSALQTTVQSHLSAMGGTILAHGEPLEQNTAALGIQGKALQQITVQVFCHNRDCDALASELLQGAMPCVGLRKHP